MTKKPRTDKKKNIGKVAEVLAKNPHATEREIAEEAEVSNGTAHNAKKELEQSWAKDPTIKYIVWSAKNRIKRSQGIFDRYLDEVEDKDKLVRQDISLVKEIVKDDQARITVLGWDITDEEWGLKSATISEKQKEAINSLASLWLND